MKPEPADPRGLLERGVKTLAVRMARHNENGQRIAEWLCRHPAVARVGIDDGFVRLSLGIEDAAGLFADLAQALAPETQ